METGITIPNNAIAPPGMIEAPAREAEKVRPLVSARTETVSYDRAIRSRARWADRSARWR